jgi:ribosomal protein S18 acetylase RimI-like enzyme
MENRTAEQIANLLNKENQLVVRYTGEDILASSDRYLFKTNEKGAVTTCIECKKVQWYQFELCHLTVGPKYRKKGLGQVMLKEAESHVLRNEGRLIQCTIRENNQASINLFTKNGFKHVSTFYYPVSGNNVMVFQKVISKKRKGSSLHSSH